MKFKTGDKIRVLSSDRSGYNYGTIHNTSIINGEDNYLLLWDHHGTKAHYYVASEVDNEWELDPKQQCLVVQSVTVKLPHGIDFIPINLEIKDIKLACDHDWRDRFDGRKHYKWCATCGDYNGKD